MKSLVLTVFGWMMILVLACPGPGWCNQPPNEFSLVSPADGASDVSIPLFLDWEDAVDPEGHDVTYTVTISESAEFTDPLLWEGERDSSLLVTADDGLKDDTLYYWKVTAIDEFGQFREAGPWSFLPSINPLDVVVKGFVFDSGTEQVIPYATVLYGGKTLTAGATGKYEGSVSFSSQYSVLVSAGCYQSKVYTVEGVDEGDTVQENFGLAPDPFGDVDGKDCVTLADAVLALRILAGVETGGADVRLAADVDGDGAIGFGEAIYAMQVVAGIR